jgi:RimJ/RimL family protein N-acetyltransferase
VKEEQMIEGELVNLRALEASDLERNYRWINDREVTRHLGMRYPVPMLAEERWMEAIAGMPMSFTNVWFAVETKDGQHIGNINFHRSDPEDRKARLGFMIGEKSFWSKGYGADALRTLLRFGFDQMNLHRIDLTVDADNARAIACYRKCGLVEEVRMRQERFTRGAYRDQLVMGVLRDEFRQNVAGGAR